MPFHPCHGNVAAGVNFSVERTSHHPPLLGALYFPSKSWFERSPETAHISSKSLLKHPHLHHLITPQKKKGTKNTGLDHTIFLLSSFFSRASRLFFSGAQVVDFLKNTSRSLGSGGLGAHVTWFCVWPGNLGPTSLES